MQGSSLNHICISPTLWTSVLQPIKKISDRQDSNVVYDAQCNYINISLK
jgi:hypothetical protein